MVKLNCSHSGDVHDHWRDGEPFAAKALTSEMKRHAVIDAVIDAAMAVRPSKGGRGSGPMSGKLRTPKIGDELRKGRTSLDGLFLEVLFQRFTMILCNFIRQISSLCIIMFISSLSLSLSL